MTDIIIEDYSDKSFVLRGEGTRSYSEYIKTTLGGKWNPLLKNKEGNIQPGWIFSNKQKPAVTEWLQNKNNTTMNTSTFKSKVTPVIDTTKIYTNDDKVMSIMNTMSTLSSIMSKLDLIMTRLDKLEAKIDGINTHTNANTGTDIIILETTENTHFNTDKFAVVEGDKPTKKLMRPRKT